MNQLSQRIPFKGSGEGDEIDPNTILDEQQQEAVISDLRKQNEAFTKKYLLIVQALIGVSSIFQFLVLSGNPLLTIFPTNSDGASLPLPIILIFLTLYIHGNLALLFFSDEIRKTLNWEGAPAPLPIELIYSLAAVPPTLSLFLGKPWQTTAWWSITLIMVFVTQNIRSNIQASNDGIAELEKMKYRAPGA
ncbi:hypothetical protein CPB83DRAFT_845915 [Crepidotus variabilis]|uniref:Uncharacterized protein n=1 Tax=Crepidotus variabilis TaxID=179855 RepID=A0A9P6EPR9_9AGAR|nr:hypothetical protein CPB83DRAFT_845915 [Crepidotus variabilis]